VQARGRSYFSILFLVFFHLISILSSYPEKSWSIIRGVALNMPNIRTYPSEVSLDDRAPVYLFKTIGGKHSDALSDGQSLQHANIVTIFLRGYLLVVT
jgi:hypothetical protein